ncbi:hypothetical protein HRI_000409900 [Hibiscus trionum]|uniref:Uncharacterized protein n=1 Tax=Hibiscus trionum TaxID=183268 RepID=A0A9W7H0G0_HIBTR|nr:hypothetical protein HRI_000409900 [Hibiscus trionum]
MPNYAKHLRDIISKRKRIGEFKTVAVTEECMAMLHNKLPPKQTDTGNFVIPSDFLILDCEADEKAPIILGRPFLATGRTLIDVEHGELTMRVDNRSIKLTVLQPSEKEKEGCPDAKAAKISIETGQGSSRRDRPKGRLKDPAAHHLQEQENPPEGRTSQITSGSGYIWEMHQNALPT